MLLTPTELTGEHDPSIACRGGCARCGREHTLPVGPSHGPAVELFRRLEQEGRIDFDAPAADPRFSIEYLLGDARGQMFGVLVVRNGQGQTGVLKAFSGQYNSVWEVDGWVPPLLDVARFKRDTLAGEQRIKAMGREILGLPKGAPARDALIDKRKKASQVLMQEIHAMYTLPNFRGERLPLPSATHGQGGVPTGTGDCCAPKLLGYAALNGLTPLGLSEFYFGRANRSGLKAHGEFYPSCPDKCARILGFMLCGLEGA
ncbi:MULTISPECIES: hypothetical protein [unclassified Pseudodesulfovibrio]|uniref:hypothetical protein n=1 Tax=unclassified Pseudodesulfovibrio TaxID=2661612 RepID=UPI000FEB6B92|nr:MULTISPECIES: hypothetical protein [unclassified Pseudodesulfovibrio]MCJ2164390.1 hypothetical protein [Pseudodesulfovibrio sp. S3-i]RWU04597.1 hypothetical protein DWB63_07530 [Pseudodesulfovibrio sp. S3]